jgi:hypothetical protein
VKLQEHHFYENKDTLLELLEKENDLKYNAALMRERREIVPSCLEELPKEENAVKERLLETGFADWSKNEYSAFLRGCEKFGRTDYARIANVLFCSKLSISSRRLKSRSSSTQKSSGRDIESYQNTTKSLRILRKEKKSSGRSSFR